MPGKSLPLDVVAERAAQLAARSTADAVSIAWLETDEGTASAGPRGRHAVLEPRRSVAVRVRAGGRTGVARSDSSDTGELDATLRAALADARIAEPSPDWPLGATTIEPVAAGGVDPDLGALTAAGAQQALPAKLGGRSSLRLDWRDARLVVAASFHPLRAQRFTSASFRARIGRRPGSGFVARTAPALAALAIDELVESGRALEAAATAEELPAAGSPLVLAGEAALVLLDAFARRALGGRARLERGAVWPYSIAAVLTFDDEVIDGAAPVSRFDFDGCARSKRRFVEAGVVRGAALDLELAARAGEPTTGHGLAADDAWPQHLAVLSGERGEAALRAAAANGVRIGSLERFAIEPGEELPFRALARNLRKIGSDGSLGTALPPAVWSGSLREVLSSVVEVGREAVVWAPDARSFGALRSPALRLVACGRFAPDRDALPR